MSKQTKGYALADFGHVTPQMISAAEGVVADQKLGRYSVSAVYKSHNAIFKLREPFQTCDSCLVTRATAIKKWLVWYNDQAQPIDPPAELPTEYKLADGTAIIVDAAGLARLAHADRSPVTDLDVVTPGDYLLADGQTLTIVEGSIATSVAIKDLAPAAPTPDGANGSTDNDAAKQPNVDGQPFGGGVEVLLQKVNKEDYSKTDGDALFAIFTASADDATKGMVVNKETGKALAAGTYATTDTTKVLSVQPGGKASYKTIA